jgi:phage baseplate assembly protein W
MLYTTSIKFPFLFSKLEGKTDIDTNFVSINRSIALILLTGKGELFGNPNFGSNLKLYQFREVTPEVQQRLSEEIVNSIIEFENRVTITNNDIQIEQAPNSDTLKISISYILKNSNALGNTQILIPIPVPTEV